MAKLMSATATPIQKTQRIHVWSQKYQANTQSNTCRNPQSTSLRFRTAGDMVACAMASCMRWRSSSEPSWSGWSLIAL